MKNIHDLESQRQFVGITQKNLCAHLGITTRTYQKRVQYGATLKQAREIRDALKHFTSQYK